MKQTHRMIISLLLLCLLTACSLPASSSNTLDGTTWKLVSYRDTQGQMVNPMPEANGTLEFSEKEVSGTTGCNHYFANYTAKGESLVLESIGNTEMACEEPRMAQESAFLAALRQVTSYRMDGDHMELLDAAGSLQLTFNALKPLPLVGTNWVMTAVPNGSDVVSSPVEGVEVTAIFSADGRLSGNSGCNSYGGNYEVDGEKLSMGPLMSTLMACIDPGVMEQESAFLQALEQAATYEVSYNSLKIFNSNGGLLVTFIQNQ